jgi:hypothetical protein
VSDTVGEGKWNNARQLGVAVDRVELTPRTFPLLPPLLPMLLGVANVFLVGWSLQGWSSARSA